MRHLITTIACSIAIILGGCNAAPELPNPDANRTAVLLGPAETIATIDHPFLNDDPTFANYLHSIGISTNQRVDRLRMEQANSRVIRSQTASLINDPNSLTAAERRERLNQILKSFFREGEYNFSYDANGNHSALDTLLSQSGNCIAFSAMVVMLSREAGLEAQFQMVDRSTAWTQRDQDTIQYVRHINVAVPISRRNVINVDIANPIESAYVDTRIISDEEATAEFLNNLGAEAMLSDDLDTAHRYFYSALLLYPDAASAWSNLGLLYRRMGEDYWAEQAFLFGANAPYDFITAQSNLERLYREQNRLIEADQLAVSIEQFREQNPLTQQMRANDAIANGDYDTALDFLEKAVDLAPELASTYYLLGLTLEKLGRHDEAQYHFQLAEQFANHQDEAQFERKRIAFNQLTDKDS